MHIWKNGSLLHIYLRLFQPGWFTSYCSFNIFLLVIITKFNAEPFRLVSTDKESRWRLLHSSVKKTHVTALWYITGETIESFEEVVGTIGWEERLPQDACYINLAQIEGINVFLTFKTVYCEFWYGWDPIILTLFWRQISILA